MNPRLFPSLQELSFARVIHIYGVEEVMRIINEDEASSRGTPVTVPGISAYKPLLIKKLQELANPIVLAVVKGDLNQTEALIKERPLLSLLGKGDAVDYSRRTIKTLRNILGNVSR